MVTEMDKELFSSLFEVGEIIASANPKSGRSKARLKVLAIESDGIRYQAVGSKSSKKVLYSYLDVVLKGFERIDPDAIQRTIQPVLLDAGLKENLWTENYAYGFAREIRERTASSFVSSGELLDPAPRKLEIRQEDGTDADLAAADLGQQIFYEGETLRVVVDRQERNPKARAACIQFHGLSCVVCDFNFESFYGLLGSGFIHVQHLKPISIHREIRTTNVEHDLVPICPNCHAMVHTSKPPLTVGDLRQIVAAHRVSLS
jgi:predicted HNH restriction endonuclease